MTFRDLQETIARLATDPRVHPGTLVSVAYKYEVPEHVVRQDDDKGTFYQTVEEETMHEQDPLCCITVAAHTLTLHTHPAEPAVAR